MKIGKWLFRLSVLALLAATALLIFGFLLPIHQTQPQMSTGVLTLVQQADGACLLSWLAAEKADGYRVEIWDGNADETENLLYREFLGNQTQLQLPELPGGMKLLLRVNSVQNLRTILGEELLVSENALQAKGDFGRQAVTILDFAVDGDEKTLWMQVEPPVGGQWEYTLTDDAGTVLAQETMAEPELVLSFGEGTSLPIPEADAPYHLQVRAYQETENLLLWGQPSNDFPVTWGSLQYRQLNPEAWASSKNTYTLTWDETRGDHYEVQLEDENGQWSTVCRVEKDAERSFTTWLSDQQNYRVISVDAQGQILCQSDPMTLTVRPLVQYATVWPVRDLTAYDSPAMERVIGTASVGKAFCVLEESGGMFAVRIGDEIGYIPSSNCMINLPEYLGGLCSYNITNSVSSIYAVHEFAIPDVTGVVTAGYEDVCQEDGTYLVPLLYPTAKKLRNAALAAQEAGYRLKIYDSFRPYIATREIYDLAEQQLNLPLPETTYTGQPRDSVEDLPQPRSGSSEVTLGWLMMGNSYALNSFLARGGSTHNYGIALDLTMEDLETGEEISMQSSMHDLSRYSVLAKNNDAAKELSRIMLGAGFGGLVSEWWHFQDDVSRAEYKPASVTYGVDAQCWVKDDFGWKYRTAKGGFLKNETKEIGRNTYSFNSNGYLVN